MSQGDAAQKLAEYIVGEVDIAHLDAQGGAWYALELLDVLQAAEGAGWTLLPPEDYPLPADLVAVLRDPSVTIDRDHEVKLSDGRSLFEHLAEWRRAPSNTASAD